MARPKKAALLSKKFIVLTMEYRKEGDLWTGVCIELGTAADGKTFDEVTEVLREMVFIHLNTLEDVGECEQFLREQGVVIRHKEPRRPTPIPATYDPNHFFNRQLIPLGNC